MKKRTINAFTLVEMLIVIVIIGILIAALMPRMQAAQWRARDVSRKTALSQIQSAIVTSQWDKWRWPGTKGCEDGAGEGEVCATNWIDVKDIAKELMAAWMNSVPTDPIQGTKFSWIWTSEGSEWEFRYVVTRRNWTEKWWFALMAKTEVEWWSNWLYCWDWDNQWKITENTDIADASQVKLCTSFTKVAESETDNCSLSLWDDSDGDCTYSKDEQLRYLLVY